ncbi:MAG: archease [Burkholderiaceae bacterium]|nr:archease [Burkholderiaceae bacterium]
MDHWEHFEHRADIGVRGISPSKEGAFEQAAVALTAVTSDPSRVVAKDKVVVHCVAPDDELLLTDWLNALVFEMATRRMLFSRFKVRMVDHSLEGEAWGESLDQARHQPAVEVKGATYTELKVGRYPDGMWFAQCVVDV